jgi:hypothetical protein
MPTKPTKLGRSLLNERASPNYERAQSYFLKPKSKITENLPKNRAQNLFAMAPRSKPLKYISLYIKNYKRCYPQGMTIKNRRTARRAPAKKF